MITGETVVHTDHALTGLRQHIRGSIEIPVAILQSPLGAIVCQALHNDAEQRFSNAKQFAQSLATIPTQSIPFPVQGEKVALNVYVKGDELLEMSSEEPNLYQVTTTAKLNTNRVLIAVIAMVTIALGVYVGMS